MGQPPSSLAPPPSPGACRAAETTQPAVAVPSPHLLPVAEVLPPRATSPPAIWTTTTASGPVVSPVFKERMHDGKLCTAPVHAKMARGALARFILTGGVTGPADLLAFGEMGWEPMDEPPSSGPWFFSRAHQG